MLDYKERHGKAPPMPPLFGGEYLIEAWKSLGMVQPSGFGPAPLSFTEIAAGKPWTKEQERDCLRSMSEGYLSGLKVGKDVLGIEPWQGDDE